MKFRKKPIVVEAVQWMAPGETIADAEKTVMHWAQEHAPNTGGPPRFELRLMDDPRLSAPTDRQVVVLAVRMVAGVVTVQPGDWLIRDAEGEVYPCRKSIFEATYEAVEGDPA